MMTDHDDNSDFQSHHMNMMADFAIASYRAPGATITRPAALDIIDRIAALHRGTMIVMCVSAAPAAFQERFSPHHLVDARPGTDLGKLLAAAFYFDEVDNIDHAARDFAAEGCEATWKERVILPFMTRAGFSSESQVL